MMLIHNLLDQIAESGAMAEKRLFTLLSRAHVTSGLLISSASDCFLPYPRVLYYVPCRTTHHAKNTVV